MEQSLKRSIILEHYQNPKNKCLLNDDSYEKINMNNESCIDEINLEIKYENGIIKDIHFDGEACAICTSSTSIMIETLIGKTLDEDNLSDLELKIKKLEIQLKQAVNEEDYELASRLKQQIIALKENADE